MKMFIIIVIFIGSLDRVVLDVFHGLQRITSEEGSCKNLTPARKELFNRKVRFSGLLFSKVKVG